MKALKEQITELATALLPDESHYVVDVVVGEKSGKKLINVYIDGDQGVTIQTCAKISRGISGEVEAQEMIEDAYVLEVSSPGVDYPIQEARQYLKNLGRDLLVYLTNGTEVLGTLLEVNEEGLKLNAKEKAKGKSKKMNVKEMSIPFTEIIKSVVQVSFK
ncbi:ribosome maturation factor RimP [Algoriphagus namhaensis]|uniref:Ribosome maturation factor RimP n=1 Tax=Algoriphagus namhaensis TaxID=915353 RepID=A0ABV8AMI0_9BACT